MRHELPADLGHPRRDWRAVVAAVVPVVAFLVASGLIVLALGIW